MPISATGAVPGRRYSLGRLPTDAEASSEYPSPGPCCRAWEVTRALGALVVQPRPPLDGSLTLPDLHSRLPGGGGC